MILVTGGAGFIGANLVRHLLATTSDPIINVDKLTYAGNLQSLSPVMHEPRHVFVRADIGDVSMISRLLEHHRPRAVIHLAAESHVDRSIHDPDAFVQTNVVGTLRLLKAVCAHWNALPPAEHDRFRFVQVSTDEVYGSLESGDPPFRETSPYRPNNPYAASKAAGDHLVRSFHQTYGLPTVTMNCTNNYGPLQFPEKLIPLAVQRALAGEAIPVYGDGGHVRDWLYVEDYCTAIQSALAFGQPGQVYNVGATNERTNLQVVHQVCTLLDQERPRDDGKPYRDQIAFVDDRPGHDRRYAIDASKIRSELGWIPKETFETGLRTTVRWYLDNQAWVSNVTTGEYRDWIARQYDERTNSE